MMRFLRKYVLPNLIGLYSPSLALGSRDSPRFQFNQAILWRNYRLRDSRVAQVMGFGNDWGLLELSCQGSSLRRWGRTQMQVLPW